MTLSDAQKHEIDESPRRAETATLRPTVPALEAILFQPIPLLDHGFIRVIDYMGDGQCRGAGGARLLRARHQEGQRGSRAHQLFDAALAHDDAVRDVPRSRFT